MQSVISIVLMTNLATKYAEFYCGEKRTFSLSAFVSVVDVNDVAKKVAKQTK